MVACQEDCQTPALIVRKLCYRKKETKINVHYHHFQKDIIWVLELSSLLSKGNRYCSLPVAPKPYLHSSVHSAPAQPFPPPCYTASGAYLFKSTNLLPHSYSIMVYSKVLARCFTKQKSRFSSQNKFCQSCECKKFCTVLCYNYIPIAYEVHILLRIPKLIPVHVQVWYLQALCQFPGMC